MYLLVLLVTFVDKVFRVRFFAHNATFYTCLILTLCNMLYDLVMILPLDIQIHFSGRF